MVEDGKSPESDAPPKKDDTVSPQSPKAEVVEEAEALDAVRARTTPPADAADAAEATDASGETPPGPTESASLIALGQHVPRTLLVLTLRGAVPFPGMMLPVVLDTDRSQQTVAKVEKEQGILVLLAQKDQEPLDGGPKDLYRMGVAGRVLKTLKLPDGKLTAMIQGMRRVRIERFVREKPFLIAKVEPAIDIPGDELTTQALARSLQQTLKEISEHTPGMGDEVQTLALNIDSPAGLADFGAAYFVRELAVRQKALEELEVVTRLKLVVELLTKELQVLKLQRQIQEEIRQKTEKMQKEFFLREQIKIIRRELGDEKDPRLAELDRFAGVLEQARMPEDVKKRVEDELARLRTTPPESPEYTVLRNYLDWLTSLPWSVTSVDRRTLSGAAKVLDDDHYGLEEVKERILEFLAVRKLKPERGGSILCFAGPPGVGKTSLGRSIAKAMGRKFWRFSLGGMRDEAEIKGHRRTYIGAMPGRILQGIKHAGTNNPVLMLDEIDKLGQDFRGDPSSALLEVLDPEQNHAFLDHYLDVPFDLSKVVFIATANSLPNIPMALLDRMEVIEIPGYLTEEKVEIAVRHLVPKALSDHGLTTNRLRIQRSALPRIVQDYTREAGVRNLEKMIARICRKVASKVARGQVRPVAVGPRNLDDYLGAPRVTDEGARRVRVPGVAQGLAWTPFGGDVLFIEAALSPGKGAVTLTGQLGEVMNESARIALHYVRSHAARFGIKNSLDDKHDLHIHFPAGAIPKDGPSAGVTIAAAILSLLRKQRFPADLAMTGELTLVGEVLPVGGIREKVLAARRMGLKRVLLPAENRRDVAELKPHLRAGLKFVYGETFGDVFAEVFGRTARQPAPRPRRAPRRR